MEIFEATIKRDAKNVSLILPIRKNTYQIVLSEDKPNDIKEVFNSILLELKRGDFNFKLVEKKEDLYSHICNEYIKQLNSDLDSVYKELEDNDMIETE
jgi:hypothetical protein